MMPVATRHVAALTLRRAEAVAVQLAEWCAARPLAVVYVLVAAVAAGISQTWFSPGRFIAAGDVGPFVRDGAAHEVAWLWSHQTSGAGGASTEIARTFEVVVSAVVTSVGFDDIAAQRTLYAVLLVGAALGTAWLAAAVSRRPWIVALAGLLGVVNPLVLIAGFNPVLIAPIGALASLGGCVVRAAHGRAVAPPAVGVLSVATSYLALNPPTLAVTVLAVGGLALLGRSLAGPGGTRRAAALLVRATPWVLACNLWWLVPYALALADATGDVGAVTDIRAWSWTHANNTVWDVAALNAHWSWTHAEYLPVAATLERPPWSWLRYALPAVALTTPLVALPPYRRRSLLAVACALVLILVGKGTHEPLGQLNVWLYDSVPGFWLLREPLNKVGPVLLLCYVLLVVVWLESVRTRLALRRPSWLRTAVPVAVAIGVLVYPWPVVTGAVIRDDGGPLPGARVAVPGAWRTVAGLINAHGGTGKALVLPVNSYYQVETTWGYLGTDTLLMWLLHRPVVQRMPGGYFAEDAQFEQTLIATERALASGRPQAAIRAMRSLGVSHVVVRRDLVRDVSGREVATAEELAEAARAAEGLTLAHDSTVADVFTVDPPHGEAVAIYGAAANAGSDAEVPVDVLPASTALVGPDYASLGGGAVAAFTHETAAEDVAFEVGEAGDHAVVAGGSSWWRVRRDREHVTLEPLDVFAVDGVVATRRQPVTVDVGHGGAAMVARSGRMLEDGQLVALEDGARIVGLALDARVRPQPSGAVEDCNAFDERTAREVGIGGAMRDGWVELRADAHSACIRIPLDVPTTAPFALQLAMRRIAGAPARACVWQVGPDACAPVDLSAGTDAWSRHRVVVHPAEGTKAVELYLYADGRDDGRTTRTAYREIELRRLVRRGDATVTAPPLTRVQLDAGPHELSVARPASRGRLGAWSRLRACGGALDDGAGVAADARSIQLRATDQVACVVAPIVGAPAEAYTVELEYRSRRGHVPRMCVWQEGPDTCAATPELAPGADWRRLRTTIRPHPDARRLELYLYADGFGDGETVTEYRDVRVLEAVPQQVAVRPAGAPSAPRMLATRRSPATYAVEVGEATGGFVLGLADSYDDGWILRGLPDGWSASHVEVDGYANGWVVRRTSTDAPPRLHLTVEHRPSVLVRWLLLLPVGAVTTSIVGRRIRRARTS